MAHWQMEVTAVTKLAAAHFILATQIEARRIHHHSPRYQMFTSTSNFYLQIFFCSSHWAKHIPSRTDTANHSAPVLQVSYTQLVYTNK